MTVEEKETIEKLEYYVENIEMHNFEKTEGFKYIKTALNLIQKQEKIIDKMAEWIYEKFKERPMTVSKAFNHNVCLWEECDDINREVNCDYCIKQYFERRVEENE